MLDAVCLLVSERAGRLKQKIQPRMVGVVTVTSRDKYNYLKQVGMHVFSKRIYRNGLKYCTQVDRRYTDVATLSLFQFEFVGWRLNGTLESLYYD